MGACENRRMTRVAYFDCFSGASGDMILGALLDAGLDFDALQAEVGKLALPAGAFHLEAKPVHRAGFAATKLDVIIEEAPRHRSLAEVIEIIRASALPAGDIERVEGVFRALGEVEAKVHGSSVEAVELHEVGAVDAMVDVTGCIVGLRLLGIEAVYASPLPLGHGEGRGSHGVLPLPAPATLELVARAGAPIVEGEGPRGEQVTPTGAALLTTLGRFERPAMRVQKVGYGAGGRDPEGRPNVLRVWLGETEPAGKRMRLIETNIDDMSPELLAYTQESLMAAGAADAWFTPIQMKKSRPATMLSVLCQEAMESSLVALLAARDQHPGRARARRRALRGRARELRVRVEPGAGGREGETPAGRAAAGRAGVRGLPSHRPGAGAAARGGVPRRRGRGRGAAAIAS